MSKQALAVQPVTAPRPIDLFKRQLELAASTIMQMVPSHVSFEKFQALAVTAVANNEKLLECTQKSLLKETAYAAEVGLSFNPALKEADMLPVWNGRISKLEAQFRPRVKGLMKLAVQSGEVTKIEAHVVYSNDDFDYELGTNPHIRHKPSHTKRGERTGAYCVWWLKEGSFQFEYMDAESILKIKDRTQSRNKQGEIVGPWVSDEDEMWRKTVIRRASKYMPLSAEVFQKAVSLDDEREVVPEAAFDNGSFIDITASEPEEPAQKPAETQTNKLAEKIAKPTAGRAPSVDHLAALTPLTQLERSVYAKTHAKELTAIEMSEPTVYKQIAELLRGEE